MGEGLGNITEENVLSLRGDIIISETENRDDGSDFFSRFSPFSVFVDVIIDIHDHFGDMNNIFDFVPNSIQPSLFGGEAFFDFFDPFFSWFKSRFTGF